ncbi:MAG: Response regulator with CheY-like receiver domain and winged-helix DNA-binding domain, partial [Frankiales bacterium]|nr:Response regulator with CheY-like receiver domain and winged-helix DNA-binding domain [Frankiales bacterium]
MHDAPRALVVDEAQAARHRVAVLLQLAGWRVYEAVGMRAALRAAAPLDPHLVVTEMHLRDGSGTALVRELRRAGSRARFLIVTARPTARIRAQVSASGGTCLAKPVHPRDLVDFLHDRPPASPARGARGMAADPVGSVAGSVAGSVVGSVVAATEADAHLLERLRTMYISALPLRISAIARAAGNDDAGGVADAARTLAAASGQVGLLDVASICRGIADEADRGVVAHAQVTDLV